MHQHSTLKNQRWDYLLCESFRWKRRLSRRGSWRRRRRRRRRAGSTSGPSSAQSLPGRTSGSMAKTKCSAGGQTSGKTFWSAFSSPFSASSTLDQTHGVHGGSLLWNDSVSCIYPAEKASRASVSLRLYKLVLVLLTQIVLCSGFGLVMTTQRPLHLKMIHMSLATSPIAQRSS